MQNREYERVLCKLVKNYKESTGIGCWYWMKDGKDDCTGCTECRCDLLCFFCHASPRYAEMCEKQSHYSAVIADELCQPYIYLCPLGLTKWAVPIISGKEQLGTLYAGCVRISKKQDKEEQKPKHFDFFNLPWETFSQAWGEVPYRTTKQVHYAAWQLFYSMCYIMETDREMITSRQKEARDQTALYEEISVEKINRQKNVLISDKGKAKNADSRNNEDLQISFEDEKELLGRIQMGDQAGVRNLLNKMFGKIFLSNFQNIPMIKTQLLELVLSVGKSARQRNTSDEYMFAFYMDISEELYEVETLSQLSKWTKKVFDQLTRLVYEHRNEQRYSVVEQITLYIKENYGEDLNLDRIAGAVGYSSDYIGRLFKEELNMSIIDYLTEVRIAKAKELLENTDELVVTIAEKVGYQYSHYFARTFKRLVGISPSEYRRWWTEK